MSCRQVFRITNPKELRIHIRKSYENSVNDNFGFNLFYLCISKSGKRKTMSILVKEVTKKYGEQKALDNVSFEIHTGEVVGFLGPNGAGKSTMMKIITGFIPPTAGEILLNDLDIVEYSLEVRKKIGYLPENNPLYLDMYVKEYLDFVAGIYKLDNKKARIEEMVERTGLQIEQKKKIGALSKGYRQRVGLAQALIHDPEVLILDEPTSGLDPNQIIEIRNLIQNVGKEKTVLLSTHIMQEVEAICDKIIVIHKGKIVANDTTSSIKTQLGSSQQIVLVEFNKEAEKNIFDVLEGISEITYLENNKWQVAANSEKDIRQDIFELAVKNNLSVLSMQQQQKSLEDIFQQLTK